MDRLTITMPEHISEELKSHCEEKRRSVSSMLTLLAEDYLADPEKRAGDFPKKERDVTAVVTDLNLILHMFLNTERRYTRTKLDEMRVFGSFSTETVNSHWRTRDALVRVFGELCEKCGIKNLL